jgi:gamma-D-glutamyl-L-lysine dipeptidyl-peptidase
VADPIAEIRGAARTVRAALAPDPRTQVFETRIRRAPTGAVVHGVTTLPAAVEEFRRRLAERGVAAQLRLRVLPDPVLAPRSEALVRAPVAPVYRRATMSSTQITQYVLGARVGLLSRRGRFYRVRGDDGHLGWVHQGYLRRGTHEWALAWERGEQGQPLFSLGAVLGTADGAPVRLPWGARVLGDQAGRVLLPDDRVGQVLSGDLVGWDQRYERFPPRGDEVVATGHLWLGAPYLWGGVTPWGVDCSGLAQAVYAMHGVALPRDSDMQARTGAPVEVGAEFGGLRPGDLLFFAEKGRIIHVALSLGESAVLHASAGNGAVGLNDLAGSGDHDRYLRRIFLCARRVLPD